MKVSIARSTKLLSLAVVLLSASTVPFAASAKDAPTSTPPRSGSTVAPITQSATITGCANPMIGKNGDDGTRTSAIFVDIHNMRPSRDPTYSKNAIFWVSRQNKPGQSVLMSGAFTANRKTVRLAPLKPGTFDWQTAVRSSAVTVPATNMSSTGLTFTIPENFGYGTYAYRIEDADASVPVLQGLINQPEIQWIVGTPSTEDSLEAPAHQLYNCGAEVGGKLRLFGKNIRSTREAYLQSTDNRLYPLTVESTDDTALIANVPPDLTPGPYHVWIGSALKDATAALPVSIQIQPAPAAATIVSCTGLNGNGSTDNTPALQACLDKHGGKGNRTIIKLPAGRFAIANTITLHPYQYLVGESEAATAIVGTAASSSTTPSAWIRGTNNFGVASLTLNAPHRDALLSTTKLGSDPLTHGHILINRVTFVVSADYTKGAETHMIKLSGPDIRVMNSNISAKNTMTINYGDGVLISGINSSMGYYGIANSQNVIITKSMLGAPSGLNDGVAIGTGRPMIGGTTANATRNLYVGYNTFRNMRYAPTNQFYTTDGGGGSYLGKLASASANSVTLAHDPNWDMVGTSNPENVAISIVAGTGVGQYRFLKSIRGRVMELAKPWDVAPDSTSVVDITTAYTHIAVSHNNFSNMHGHDLNSILFFGGVFDSVIDHNHNVNAGDGIAVAAYGPYGENSYLPTFNVDVLDNTVVEDGNAGFIAATAKAEVDRGLAVRGMPGAALSGVLVRGNTIGRPGKIFFPNSFKDDYSVLVEQNRAIVHPWFAGSPGPRGALIRDNRP